MHRFARKGLTLSAFIGMLSACATLQWSTIFSWENGFGAIPAVVHPGTDGGILLAGGVRTNFDDSGGLPVYTMTGLVASYSADGVMQWHRELGENFAFLYEGGVESLVTSSDGSLYVGSHQNDIAVFTKLDTQGRTLWERQFFEDSAIVTPVRVLNDNLIIIGLAKDISSQGPDELVAFDTNGNELWRYSGVGRQDPEGLPPVAPPLP